MMYHHDGRDYDFAVTQAANQMRERLHSNIQHAKDGSMRALERVQKEIPHDKIVSAKSLTFDMNNEGQMAVQYKVPRAEIVDVVEETIHPWAFGQIAEHARIPKNYVQYLMSLSEVIHKGHYHRWGAKLAVENLNELFLHMPPAEKRLIRSVEKQTRGFLSTKYKRRHPGYLLDGFIGACRKFDLLPYVASATDTRHMVRAVLDGIVEPVPNECLGIGVVYSESPYGNGATAVSIFVERMWCTNTAVLSTDLRSTHLGSRLSDDFAWSEETYLADTRATVHQMQDLLEAYVSPASLRRLSDTVRLAHETKIEPKQLEAFIKKNLSKEDAEAVGECYRSADVEMLPAGNTIWRASNALSFFANKVEDEDKKFDLQKLAGQLLAPMAKAVEKKSKK